MQPMSEPGISVVPMSSNPSVLKKSTFWCSPFSDLRMETDISKSSFDFLQKIGDGVFGGVFVATLVGSETKYAVKVISKRQVLKLQRLHQVIREKDVHEMVTGHQNVVALECVFQDEDHIYYVTEFAEKGTLDDLLKSQRKLDTLTARNIISEILSALEHLRRFQIIHRDLRPENILLDHNYHVKLGDFGEAKQLGAKPIKSQESRDDDEECQDIDEDLFSEMFSKDNLIKRQQMEEELTVGQKSESFIGSGNSAY